MTQLEKLMKLGLSKAEAEQVLEDDKRIDKGEKLFELTAEQKKASKQATITHNRTKNVKTERKKAENPLKIRIIEYLFNKLLENGEIQDVKITNSSRMISFSSENKQFELTLVEKRAKK